MGLQAGGDFFMDQAQEDKLKELYRQYGEIVIKLEYFQGRYMEIKNQILKILNGQPNK